jgi:ABC-2 type transport system ATP-binding protein
MSDEVVITVENVSKNFTLPHERVTSVKSAFTNLAKGKGRKNKETQHALRNISFEVKKGEFFGIVGRNGSGKSTMLKILAGIYQPTAGSVKTRGKLVPFIELGVGFNPELTGRENVYLNGAMLGFSKKEIDEMYDDIVDFAELSRFMDQKLKNYSSGMQVRLAFSMATRADADILIVDEVLAVGDADFQRKCFEYFKYLKKNKKTVVFVSHDMGAVKEFCERAILIEKNEIIKAGSSQEVAREYSQLFMGKSKQAHIGKKRWGNGDVSIQKVKARLADGFVIVDTDIVVNRNVDKLIYGIHISAADGTEITAANNRMLDIADVKSLVKGDKLLLQWKLLNIFNDGTYSITITLIDDTANTLDWWVDATEFDVRRIQRSTTAVLPPIEATINLSKEAR